MKLLLALCGLIVLAAAEPRLRLNSGEVALRRAGDFFRKRGSLWAAAPAKSTGYTSLAEKRRVRELFGKRSAPSYDEQAADPLPNNYDDQYQSIEDLFSQMHRDRRGRVRELFG
ncbi:hypothetical protein Q1695_004832 [Nippostrongylus brasiliensis]|nr:hypothetical protein Q1695_004832 [Nippostrongylus brasiliensis]